MKILFATLKISSKMLQGKHPIHLRLNRRLSNFTVENKAKITHHEEKGTVSIILKYVNNDLCIDKEFFFQQKSTKSTASVLKGISNRINDFICKKSLEKNVDPSLVEINLISKSDNNIIDIFDLSCLDSFVNGDNCLIIGNDAYHLNVNDPQIIIQLPKRVILAGFVLYPYLIGFKNFRVCDFHFEWFVSKRKFNSVNEGNMFNSDPEEWKKIGEGFHIYINEDNISRLIKVVVTPGNEDLKGPQIETISSTLVSEMAEHCPFENRHRHTQHVLNTNFVRVVSYNILANVYATSDLAQTRFFRACPPNALHVEYRKPLFIKELIGYNADIICLQEVDRDIFHQVLKHLFPLYNLQGSFLHKLGMETEGTATFYRKDKFNLIEEKCFELSKELTSNSLFKEFFETLEEGNKEVLEEFSKQRVTLQILKLARADCPEKMVIVGNTHLSARPEVQHLRLIQAWMVMRLLKNMADLHKEQNPSTSVSLLLCGDFNSQPQSAVYRLVTSQQITSEDEVWSNNNVPEVKEKNITLSSDVALESACGTPRFTNYTIDFKACIDYIFYEKDNFTVDKIVPFPSEEELKKNVALPNIVFPSDHIALVADLKWKDS